MITMFCFASISQRVMCCPTLESVVPFTELILKLQIGYHHSSDITFGLLLL